MSFFSALPSPFLDIPLLTGGGTRQFAPISGSFPHFAGRFFDRALGFAVGWNYM